MKKTIASIFGVFVMSGFLMLGSAFAGTGARHEDNMKNHNKHVKHRRHASSTHKHRRRRIYIPGSGGVVVH